MTVIIATSFTKSFEQAAVLEINRLGDAVIKMIEFAPCGLDRRVHKLARG